MKHEKIRKIIFKKKRYDNNKKFDQLSALIHKYKSIRIQDHRKNIPFKYEVR